MFAGLLLFFIGAAAGILIWRPAPPPHGPPGGAEPRPARGLTDQEPQNPFACFSGTTLSVMRSSIPCAAAEKDTRVKGVLIRLPDTGMAPAAADELRLAVKRLRAAGKPVYAHSQGLYPAGVVTSTYELGASADQIWMQPGAFFQAAGFATDDLFFKRFFDKYGVKPQYEQRYEYKNAVNPYLHDDYTPAHKEAELSWMGSIYTASLASAASDRKRDPAALRAAVEASPLAADDARARPDRPRRPGRRRRAGPDPPRRGGDQAGPLRGLCGRRPRRRPRQRRRHRGDRRRRPDHHRHGGHRLVFGGDQTIYSDDVAGRIQDAIEDDDVKAIVLRVSSPGGSDTASEQILSAVRAAKAAKKPVVVSMGTYAASGGYWISRGLGDRGPADHADRLDRRLRRQVRARRCARAVRRRRAPDDGGRRVRLDLFHRPGVHRRPARRLRPHMDVVYEGFIARVSKGRNLPPDRVREIAKGRVWTGARRTGWAWSTSSAASTRPWPRPSLWPG